MNPFKYLKFAKILLSPSLQLSKVTHSHYSQDSHQQLLPTGSFSTATMNSLPARRPPHCSLQPPALVSLPDSQTPTSPGRVEQRTSGIARRKTEGRNRQGWHVEGRTCQEGEGTSGTAAIIGRVYAGGSR